MPQHVKIYEQVLPADLCERIIARFEQDKRVAPDPQPDYSTRHYINISQQMDWMSMSGELCRHVNEVVGRYFARPDELAHGTYHEWSDDGYVVSRYAVGDTCVLHIDGQSAVEPNNGLRIATVVFYLNDVSTGGETSFPLQDLKVAPRQGRAVVFPVGYTHPHEVLAATSPRYIMQTWITDPNFLVLSACE
ncbi:MAG: 2OG-Fe(II) oxygenase [Proteobacteria bacterium]|nr:2OG-Fe(II) oxygenase [Pseudomonadota bacterium]